MNGYLRDYLFQRILRTLLRHPLRKVGVFRHELILILKVPGPELKEVLPKPLAPIENPVLRKQVHLIIQHWSPRQDHPIFSRKIVHLVRQLKECFSPDRSRPLDSVAFVKDQKLGRMVQKRLYKLRVRKRLIVRNEDAILRQNLNHLHPVSNRALENEHLLKRDLRVFLDLIPPVVDDRRWADNKRSKNLLVLVHPISEYL